MTQDRHAQFIAAVRSMRDAQRLFFTTRDSEEHKQALIESKRLEKRVDRMLTVLAEADETQNLFESEVAP